MPRRSISISAAGIITDVSDHYAIEVKGLRKTYGEFEAVRGIDFTVPRGEVFGLLGPNGAGKTTTVEILEGYRARSAGEVTVLGFDPGRAATGAARPRRDRAPEHGAVSPHPRPGGGRALRRHVPPPA